MLTSRGSMIAAPTIALAVALSGAALVVGQGHGSPSSHPGDGVPDPDGRIAFGRIVRMDDFYGQVVALYAIDPDGSDLVQLNDGESAFPAWSPDGTRLAFTQGQADGSWQIATMAGDGQDVRVLTSGSGVSEVPSWSPDGSWIAYAHSPTLPVDDTWHTVLHRMDADGSNQELLGNPDTFDVEPRISPDGTRVLFQRLTFDEGYRRTLVVREVMTGKELVIEAAGTAVGHANWSPDGDWIIYDISSEVTGDISDERLERVPSDGSGEPVVIWDPPPPAGVFKPWYSPDGRRLVVGCVGAGGDDAMCLLEADGSNVRVLVDEPGVHENHLSWGVSAP